MPDYSKSVIYCISCKDESIKEVYVGSSIDFEGRKKCHKERCIYPIKFHDLKVYKYIRANGGWDNFEMKIIEYYPCENKFELGKREYYWMNELQSKLNDCSPAMYESYDEYYNSNREKILNRTKEYYNNNQDKIKKYRESNKEKIKEYNKEYGKIRYEKNKEQISEKAKEKMTCQCGRTFVKSCKSRHEKSQIHINFINNL